ncbi:MAG TPA: glucoamylase family protein [Pyrinomonadaceae bacterium]|nr:glucoamylase family protein [Pyrinomonadaceae bacterium]
MKVAKYSTTQRFFRSLGATLLLIAIACVSTPAQTRTNRSLSKQDDAFLEDLSRRSFRFFWERADPKTGLVSDRARASGAPYDENHRSRNIASSAATGFGLTALCIAAERGWVDRKAVRERVLITLRFYAERSPHERGFFYHFVDKETGERRWNSEISTIDTALLLGGVLTARQYFHHDPEIVRLATLIYERVDFPWMLVRDSLIISMGWRPETGFIKSSWNHYSEHTMLQLLAIGSPTHPIKPGAWMAWHRLRLTYAGYTYLTFLRAPLFVHQYSQAWVDFRDQEESWYPYTNYFENSVKATLAHREFCKSLSDKFPGYSDNVWGITASDSAKGYRAWGGPPPTPDIDGTVVPCAAAGSLMFTPEITLAALKTMHERWGDRIYDHYGFVDAFNPNNGWVNPDVIGIDLGITILSAENLRTGNVWRWFMRNTEIPKAMRLAGFRKSRRAPRRRIKVQTPARTGRKSLGNLSSVEVFPAISAPVR